MVLGDICMGLGDFLWALETFQGPKSFPKQLEEIHRSLEDILGCLGDIPRGLRDILRGLKGNIPMSLLLGDIFIDLGDLTRS